MFWNDLEQCLESIILIEDEDDILSIPRQIQVYCICLGLSQANKPVSLYSVHTVQCTMYTLYKPTAGNQDRDQPRLEKRCQDQHFLRVSLITGSAQACLKDFL